MSMRPFGRRALSALLMLLALPGAVSAQQAANEASASPPQSIILRLHPGMGISADSALSLHSSKEGAHLDLLLNLDMAILEVPVDWDIEALAEELRQDPAVQQAIMDTLRITLESPASGKSPNDLWFAQQAQQAQQARQPITDPLRIIASSGQPFSNAAQQPITDPLRITLESTVSRKLPNDPWFAQQWHLNDTSDNDADIDAPEGWAYETGSTEVVIAVFDTGIDYLHPDIKNNLWVNHAEADGQDGADDDGNGYVDDIYGYNVCDRDGDPWDDEGHGTRVSSLIAAQGNNNYQYAGVSWRARIMSVKVSNCVRETLGNILQSAEYVLAMKKRGVPIRAINISLSTQSAPIAQLVLWRAAVNRLRNEGILIMPSAGNERKKVTNADSLFVDKFYDNVIVVGATDRNRRREYNYNPDLVDLGAPGLNIPIPLGSYSLATRAYSRFNNRALFSSAANSGGSMWTVGDAWSRQGAEWRLEVMPGQGLPGLMRANGDRRHHNAEHHHP